MDRFLAKMDPRPDVPVHVFDLICVELLQEQRREQITPHDIRSTLNKLSLRRYADCATQLATQLGWKNSLAEEWGCEWPLRISRAERDMLLTSVGTAIHPRPGEDRVVRAIIRHRVQRLLRLVILADSFVGCHLEYVDLE